MDAEKKLGLQRTILLISTLMLAGRAMTLAFIGDAGAGGLGDPPSAWLMPLVGDAVIGIAALPIAYLILKGHGLGAWTAIVTWNVVGIWDALSAFLVHQSVPWPEFFMIEIFGPSMFFAASAMHLVNLWLVSRPDMRTRFLGVARSTPLEVRPRRERLQSDA
ncbi:MAG: hypothetical protein ACN4GZ_11245 [Acidimicrobiales bacterium]